MWILMLEGAAALFLLVFIVWWTMFHGREPEGRERGQSDQHKEDNTPGD